MSEAYQLVFDLVSVGQVDYDALHFIDKVEVVAHIYNEGSSQERSQWLFDYDMEEAIDCVGSMLLRDNKESYEEFAECIKKIMVEAFAFKARKLFEYIVDNMEENDELCNQDSDYTQSIEMQL